MVGHMVEVLALPPGQKYPSQHTEHGLVPVFAPSP